MKRMHDAKRAHFIDRRAHDHVFNDSIMRHESRWPITKTRTSEEERKRVHPTCRGETPQQHVSLSASPFPSKKKIRRKYDNRWMDTNITCILFFFLHRMNSYIHYAYGRIVTIEGYRLQQVGKLS